MQLLKIRRDILALEVSMEECEEHQSPHPRVSVLRKEVPTISGCKN